MSRPFPPLARACSVARAPAPRHVPPAPPVCSSSSRSSSRLAACDSGGDDVTLDDVAGTYDVAEFRFRPNVGALAAANVLDTLVATNTSLRIRNSGDVTFEYQFRGGPERAINGEAEVRGNRVQVRFDSDTDAQRGRLLLPQSVTFDRDGGELSALLNDTRVNLEAFDPEFYGDDGENDDVRGGPHDPLEPAAPRPDRRSRPLPTPHVPR